MPFDEENDDEQPSVKSTKVGLKNVSSQKSIFDSMPKKPTQNELDIKVKKMQEKDSSYKSRTSELALQFKKALDDKTLVQNKNVFAHELEKEILGKMIQLAVEINNDINEPDSMGSLSWITLLLKTCFNQRDKINNLEYMISNLEKNTNLDAMTTLIKKEIKLALDKPSGNE